MIGRFARQKLFFATSMWLAVQAPASAATILGVEALQTWNLIVFGDVRSGAAVEGRGFIGGNLASGGASYYGGSQGKGGDSKQGEATKGLEGEPFVNDRGGETKPSSLPGLTVVGNIEGREIGLANAAGAQVGGNVDALLRLDGLQSVEIGGSSIRQDAGDGDVRSDLGKDFTEALVKQRDELRESLTSLSANLAALKPTGEIKTGEKLVIEGGKGLNVYSLSLDAFREAKEISVTAADGSTIVINVSGESAVLAASFLEGSSNLGKNVVWNFIDARDLVFDSAFLGTVLAPGALVTSNDYLEGTLVAAGFAQGGELRLANFQGDLSAPHSGGDAVAVSAVSAVSLTPEPTTWAMLMVGFGLIGAAMRRRGPRPQVLQPA